MPPAQAADLTENLEIYISHLNLTPPYGGSHENFAKMFCTVKTRMSWLPYADDSIYMLSCLGKITQRDR